MNIKQPDMNGRMQKEIRFDACLPTTTLAKVGRQMTKPADQTCPGILICRCALKKRTIFYRTNEDNEFHIYHFERFPKAPGLVLIHLNC